MENSYKDGRDAGDEHVLGQGIATLNPVEVQAISQVSPARLDYLDGWRGMAISALLLGHFANVPGINLGRLGVDLFFVLSGLLMARLLFIQQTPIKTFYKRRISRIFPAFFLFLGCIFGVGYLFGITTTRGEYLATLTFLRTYFPADLSIWSSKLPIGHIWSLNIEEHTYIFLSIIAFLFRRTTWLALTALASAVCATFYCFIAYARMAHPPHDFALRTECGASLILLSCVIHLFLKHYGIRLSAWIAPALLVLAPMVYTNFAPWYASTLFAPFLLAISVNGLEYAPQGWRRFFSQPLLRWLGVTSYSIYLWQQPFYVWHEVFPLYLGLPAGILLSSASFYGFENPLRRWLNRVW
jgi:peptidoglycan/LPS O-acetylase OafA/YrhL